MITLRNHLTGERDLDRLHKTSHVIQKRNCPDICLGSTFGNGGPKNEASVQPRIPEEVKSQALKFLSEYYNSIHKANSSEHLHRLTQVKKEIEESNGTYKLTEDELNFGVKLAWRNAPRCIGRIQWQNIKVFDAREITSTKEMFDAISRHINYTTNNGKIRSTITVFPERRQGKVDFRIWNHFIISYAAYQNPDGTILGQSLNLELTELCIKLGWKSPNPRTKHDILPLVLSANGNDPELFVIPPELILEVNLEHPEFSWFKELDIRWFAIPFLSAMLFDCGGLEFPAAPFNGWFTSPEIASRELGDVNKYNYLKEVATYMGLNTEKSTSLWKDKAMVELNIAVLYSFQKAGVTIIDHHTAAEQFMVHLENEKRERGGCPADWGWIVPPISGSTVPVFHQEMALYFLKPSYEYQETAWKGHTWKNEMLNTFGKKTSTRFKKSLFRQVALVVIFTKYLFLKQLRNRVRATILYATETGKSEVFAKRLQNIFSRSFNVKVLRMDKYDVKSLHENSLLLVITSTFGNGDPPINGESFYKYIAKLKSEKKMAEQNKISDSMSVENEHPLQHLRFAVFALGSSAYPNVCAFGRNLDYSLNLLGGQQLISVPCGDELSGQEEAFRKWSTNVYQSACEVYVIKVEKVQQQTIQPSSQFVRFKNVSDTNFSLDLESYEKLLHGKRVSFYNLVDREFLHEPLNDAKTLKIVLEASSETGTLEYRVGDHIGILAQNQTELVDVILDKLTNKPETDDTPVELQEKNHAEDCLSGEWRKYEKIPLPTSSLRQLLQNIFDITTPPSQEMLSYFESIAMLESEKSFLNKLANDLCEYEAWKQFHWPHLVTVLEMFPSCRPDAAVLCSLLPILQQRYYSVSSSSKVYANQFHLTIGVVKYTTMNGDGKVNLGVCSNYLNTVDIGSRIPCMVRNTLTTTFRLPEDNSRSLIMIGPGTGIAPFRGFWQERQLLKQNGNEFGKVTLFFGCRSKLMILYEKEINEMLRQEVITNYFVAFSREKSIEKTYVQDLILENGQDIVKQIFEEMAIIYICGDAAMAENVFQTLQKLIQKEKQLSFEEGKDFMRFLKESDRCHMDIFGQTHKGRRQWS